MENIRAMCDEIMRQSYVEKVKTAKSAYALLLTMFIVRGTTREEASHHIFGTCLFAVSLDGKVNENEVKLMNEISDENYTVASLTKTINGFKELSGRYLEMLSHFRKDFKEAFLILIICICTIDNDLDVQELYALEKYFS